MKVFSFRMNSTNLYLFIVKGINIEDAWEKLQVFTNLAKSKSDFTIKELDNDVNSIN